MKKCFLLLLLLPLSVHANDWTKEDTTNQIIVTIALGADWLQTRYIATHPLEHTESNPILGPHPTVQAVDQYFLLCAIGHYWISKNLSPRYRRHWQHFWIMVEGTVVAKNISMGVKFQL